ncbi:hypothetical protein D8674_006543 [Pyrus ussuriensis x Pyrus communis]|uniref:Uncharacterized protein n=1 Tax=Pyrus ussuriensis x Pyrus communis TaxID=2448454 RepID=A0A5N5FUK8_9ROSA|nr:hypothetical protein D8674_006543 [Pyrus ussuriensis x Pyrus communis]
MPLSPICAARTGARSRGFGHGGTSEGLGSGLAKMMSWSDLRMLRKTTRSWSDLNLCEGRAS